MKKILVAGAALGLSALALAWNPQDERAAVERAVLDYVEAIEQGKPELMKRGVHPELKKFGFYRAEPGGDYQMMPMDYEALVKLAGEFKANGYVPDDATHEVELLDVMDKTAAAKLTAFWGIDYMHLAKHDDKWQIVHVLWQSKPEAARTDG